MLCISILLGDKYDKISRDYFFWVYYKEKYLQNNKTLWRILFETLYKIIKYGKKYYLKPYSYQTCYSFFNI